MFLGTGSWAPDSHSAFRRIGDLSEQGPYFYPPVYDTHCTGALFGRRLVITMASCVIWGDGNIRWNTRFTPRRRGSTYPYGSSILVGMRWPAAYTANNCHTSYHFLVCSMYNFAVLILPESPGFTTHPGWMGFVYANDATTASWQESNVGYPRCFGTGNEPYPSASDAPANCMIKEPFGDLYCAGVTPKFKYGSSSNAWPFGNGANPVIENGCDASHGHDGGPIYTNSAGSNGPYIIGILYEDTYPSTGSTPTPYETWGLRINSTLGNWMLWLRQSAYP